MGDFLCSGGLATSFTRLEATPEPGKILAKSRATLETQENHMEENVGIKSDDSEKNKK